MAYWLMKSEPSTFGIDDLRRCKKPEGWDGVRNYQARNMMRDQMRKGDLAFFYHSNCEQPGIVGIMEIAHEAIPDHTAFDPDDSHYDPKSDPEAPRWWMVGVRFKEKFKQSVTLHAMKQIAALEGMPLVKRGNRLSIMPVSRSEWQRIIKMAQQTPSS